jgi:glucose 1-dehydrogenase
MNKTHVEGNAELPGIACQTNLIGQPALITGASTGIGKATALESAKAGADIVVNTGDQEPAEEIAHQIEACGRRVIAIKADVSKEDQVLAMFATAINHFDTLHIVVNNAGLKRDAPFDQMSLEQWNTVIGVNLTGQFLCGREAEREFKRRGIQESISVAAGKIICISSVHQQIPWAVTRLRRAA